MLRNMKTQTTTLNPEVLRKIDSYWRAANYFSVGQIYVYDNPLLKRPQAQRCHHANIRQNLFFACIYNALGVPVAAGVLYPLFGILLSPIIAAAAMSLSSVSVIGNALRLRRTPL